MVICDKNFKVKASLRDPSYGKRPIFTMPVFFRMGDKMYYHHAYNDTLYNPTTEGLMAEYVWNCGERSLTLDQYQNLATSGNGRFPVKRMPEQYFYKFAWYTYADSVLFFSGVSNRETYHIYYSLASGKARILNIKNLVDDIWGRNMKITPYASEEDYFYARLSLRVFIKNGGSLTEGPFAGHTEDDNPVFLKFKYRKF